MEEEIKTKVCTKCGEEKPMTVEYFHRHSGCRGGFDSSCKECNNNRNKLYYKQNSVIVKNRTKIYKIENIEKVKECQSRYRNNNSEKIKALNSEYRKKHPEKKREWRISNAEKIRLSKRLWRSKNIDRVRECANIWYNNNSGKVLYKQRCDVRNMSAPYIRLLIKNQFQISNSEIDSEMIYAKRRELKYYRIYNQLKKELK